MNFVGLLPDQRILRRARVGLAQQQAAGLVAHRRVERIAGVDLHGPLAIVGDIVAAQRRPEALAHGDEMEAPLVVECGVCLERRAGGAGEPEALL